MNTEILGRLSALRKFMADNGLSAYITFSTDPHAGEYVPSHWESRKWISGFTGSAGTVVVTLSDAGLWTDSRYFLQAEEQLEDTGIRLFRDRVEGTPSISAWLCDVLPEGSSVGVDGYTSSLGMADSLRRELSRRSIGLVKCQDPYETIWDGRPSMPLDEPFVLDEKFAGENVQSKLSRVRSEFEGNGSDCILISSLDEIAWVLNMRGTDVHCNPLFLAYLLVSSDNTILYINESKLASSVKSYLSENGIMVKGYSEIACDLQVMRGMKVQVSDEVNLALYDAASLCNEVAVGASPVKYMKAVKNEVEISGIRSAMIRDGVAMVKFLKWLTESVTDGGLTEFSIDKKLFQFRSSQDFFRGISFDTIAGYQEHGAIVHYEATEDSASVLMPEGFLLLDSGAHYLDGTTDITRTIPLGPISDEQKTDYTLLLKGFIQLSMAEFPHGTCGTQLDVLARMYMWRHGINYGHGTGHGVGHFLNVHEGPHQIRMNNVPAPLLPGMTVTNEPGIYRAGKYGIRTENTMLVVPSRETEFGQFYKFEQLTMCPISLKPVLFEMLTDEEIKWLDEYHEKVVSVLSPYLSDDEKSWLCEVVKI